MIDSYLQKKAMEARESVNQTRHLSNTEFLAWVKTRKNFWGSPAGVAIEAALFLVLTAPFWVLAAFLLDSS